MGTQSHVCPRHCDGRWQLIGVLRSCPSRACKAVAIVAETKWPFRIAYFSHIGAGWGVNVAIQTIIRWSTVTRYQPQHSLRAYPRTYRGPGSVGPVVPPRIGCGFFTFARSIYNPKSWSSDCPGASSKSLGGMTVDFMSTGLEGLYPCKSSEPRNEPDAEEGSGMFKTCEGSTGPGTDEPPETPDA